MVEILPMSSKLEDISEREIFEVVFSYKATPPDANTTYTIKEFKISEYRPNKGVTVEETKISGEYRDSFSLGADSLKYITKDRIKKSAVLMIYQIQLPQIYIILTLLHVYRRFILIK